MKYVNKTMGLWLLVGILAGCTTETVRKGGGDHPQPGGNGDEQRREVQLSLNNDLILKKTAAQSTRADESIATVEENAITSLDVYVFGSATENGVYSFQERFAYRADDAATLPAGATLLDLQPVAGTTNRTQALLKLKKGLFVKLYCIANSPTLINPANNLAVEEGHFVGLTFTDPGKAGTGVATEGTPTETQFVTFHTPLLDANRATDLLLTPLAMSGSYTIPVDLTDFESSARVQLGFRLTRLAARFDVVNNADESRFTLQEITMGNARRGAGYFPIRIYGQTPDAAAGELITLPVRPFDGAHANAGTQTGAFYSYPSPLEDKGYLILKGIYQVNQTEQKEVSYQIPFTQQGPDGSATAIAINNNHRYTIGITAADDYHLDFTLQVADWTDSGKIDEYTPDTENGAISVSIPEGDTETQYDAASHTVAMSLNAGTTFSVTMDKTSGIRPIVTKTYTGGLSAQQYDWLEITEPPVLASAPLTKAEAGDAVVDGYQYTFSLKEGYNTENYCPRAIVRFANPTNGKETVLFVDPLAAPVAVSTTQAGSNNPNTFNPNTREADVYRLTNSNLRIRLLCPVGVELGDYPAWLTSSEVSENNGESIYSFTLNNVDATPTDDKGTIVFKNAKYPDKTLEVTVNLLVPDITPDFTQLGGEGNTFTPAVDVAHANVSMRIADGNTFKFTTTSPKGVQIDMNFNGGPAWLSHDGETAPTRAGTESNSITFSLVKEKLFGAKKATITLKNKNANNLEDYVFTVTPDFMAPELTSSATMALDAEHNSGIPTIQITGNCYGGSRIVAEESPEWLTYEATSTTENTFSYKVTLVPGADKTTFPTALPGNQTITLASASNPEKMTTVTVSFSDKGWMEEGINEDAAYGSNPKTEYRVKTAGKTLTLTVYSMFTPTVETGYYSGYGTSNTDWLPAPTAPKNIDYDKNRKKFTYEIVVPATSGVDPDYQLHRGTITVKRGTTQIKKLTIWRGASNIPYPTNRDDNAFYSAVKKGGIWWAPLNLGASRIATNVNDVANAGNLYQWGRNVPTFHGGSQVTGPLNADTNDEFITSTQADRWDWLRTQDNNLWSSYKTTKDPCPNGWRVPTINELRTCWTTGTWVQPILTISGENGINLVLPAVGRRLGGGGSDGQGRYGNYWSSTPYGADAERVDIYGPTATFLNNRARVNALSIRCVKQ